MIIDVLSLEDIQTTDIQDTAPLFNEGLGLDSIDALELGVAIQKRYNIKLDADSDMTKVAFSSVSNLAEFISTN